MKKTIAIVGFGPGTSTAVAERFGAEGFNVALIGRNEQRLAAGVSMLKARGVDAFAFPADAGNPASIRAAIRSVRSQVGPISVIQWSAYGGLEPAELLADDNASLRGAIDVAVFGLLAAASEALPDLKHDGTGAILVSNGALAEATAAMDLSAVQTGAVGLALSGAAKHKLVGLLAQRLKDDGVYVAEVMVHASIKNTPGESADYGIVDPAVIAQKYWELYQARSETRADIAPANA
jgi:NAD(P)-dependent dehydrogenase (short-subunit alcohol dehydrogenase family)